MQGAQATILPDGQRLHLHHGPIDLIIEANGAGLDAAYQRAIKRFKTILEELVAELPDLRAQGQPNRKFMSPVAQRMQKAIAPYCDEFVTPMAAVAGAVADNVLKYICDGPDVDKAYVNNGGDIAFHLTPGNHMTVALASISGGQATVTASDSYRGIATSGWRGRSMSLGIADAVTVIARTAASADVAATMIANAVDLPDCSAISRTPAAELYPESDLGDRLVTTDVGELSTTQVEQALKSGRSLAEQLLKRDLIGAVCLQLGDSVQQIGFSSLDRTTQFDRPQIEKPDHSNQNLSKQWSATRNWDATNARV